MPSVRIARIAALLSLVFAVAFLAPRAEADIEWEPPRMCSEAEYQTLVANLSAACRRREELSCLDAVGCITLRSIKVEFTACREANRALNLLCYGGASVPLKIEVVSLDHEIEVCDLRIPLPFPIGCGRPCPR